MKYEGFKELLGRLRDPSLKLHMILSTNPVSKGNCTYKQFFKDDFKKFHVLDDEELYEKKTIVIGHTYYHHSTADDNLFLPESYIEQLDELEIHDPDLHRVARKGRFVVNGTLVLPQFRVRSHESVMDAIRAIRNPVLKNGMDFGFVESYNALIRIAIDHDEKILYFYWRYFNRGVTDVELADELEKAGMKSELIKADNAEPKTIAYFRQRRFRMVGTKKGVGSRLQSTKKVTRFKKIICSDACPDVVRELEELTFKIGKDGLIIEDEFNIDPHTFSAIGTG